MKFKKINPDDERKTVFASFNVAELKRIYNALALDMAGDDAAGVADPGKAELLGRIGRLVPQ